jgi:hypothetical protein
MHCTVCISLQVPEDMRKQLWPSRGKQRARHHPHSTTQASSHVLVAVDHVQVPEDMREQMWPSRGKRQDVPRPQEAKEQLWPSKGRRLVPGMSNLDQ